MKLLPIMKKSGSYEWTLLREDMVDDDFYEYSLSNNLRWISNGRGKYTYAMRRSRDKYIVLHREVLERAGHIFQPGDEVDHLDRNTFNNQKANLEVKSRSGNQRNRKLNKNSILGIKGISRWYNRYRAKILIDGKQKHLGMFDTKEEAGYAYDDAVVQLTGSWKGINQDLGLLPWRTPMTDQLKLVLKGKPMTDPKLDRIAETYIKIRDARSALKKQYEAEDLKLKDQLEVLDGHLLKTLQDLGAESVRTEHGTVYRSLAVKPSCEDWGAFYEFIKENDAFDALERRVKKSFVVTYMEDNKDELPPGITVQKEWTVTIRRS